MLIGLFKKKKHKNSEEKFVRLGPSSLRPQDLIDRKKMYMFKGRDVLIASLRQNTIWTFSCVVLISETSSMMSGRKASTVCGFTEGRERRGRGRLHCSLSLSSSSLLFFPVIYYCSLFIHHLSVWSQDQEKVLVRII